MPRHRSKALNVIATSWEGYPGIRLTPPWDDGVEGVSTGLHAITQVALTVGLESVLAALVAGGYARSLDEFEEPENTIEELAQADYFTVSNGDVLPPTKALAAEYLDDKLTVDDMLFAVRVGCRYMRLSLADHRRRKEAEVKHEVVWTDEDGERQTKLLAGAKGLARKILYEAERDKGIGEGWDANMTIDGQPVTGEQLLTEWEDAHPNLRFAAMELMRQEFTMGVTSSIQGWMIVENDEKDQLNDDEMKLLAVPYNPAAIIGKLFLQEHVEKWWGWLDWKSRDAYMQRARQILDADADTWRFL